MTSRRKTAWLAFAIFLFCGSSCLSGFSSPPSPANSAPSQGALSPSPQITGDSSLQKIREQIVFTTVPLAFALLHLLLYVFYPRLKENLHYALVSLFSAASNFLNYLPESQNIIIGLRLTGLLIGFFGLKFIYSLFYPRPPRQFYFLSAGLAGIGLWILVHPPAANSAVFFIFMLFILSEFIRVCIRAIAQKKRRAWIIGIGLMVVVVVAVYEQLMDIFAFNPLLGIYNPTVYAGLAFIISMSVYLALSFAGISRSLEKRSEELHRLNIELEDRVARRTEDLNRANAALEEQNLSLEKSRAQIQSAHRDLQKAHQELRQAQTRLVQSEKMASLGQLVAGVAHEINTPIGAVNSAADTSARAIDRMRHVLPRQTAPNDPGEDFEFNRAFDIIDENNRIILTALERITGIVRSLRSFARLDEADFQITDIHGGLESTLTLLRHELGDRITIVREYGDIPAIECYPNQLNQVFMNILKNASQAIKDQGTIGIKTGGDAKEIRITFTDDGEGIEERNLSKIFDPGFTTKGAGVGTGLGLSISYNIIRDHKGEITVESQPGRGSRFTITLPVKQA